MPTKLPGSPPRRLPLAYRDFFVIDDLEGFTPHISRLVHMLEYVRFNTLWAVRDLSTEALDAQIFPGGNTIGTLLAHMAGTEAAYGRVTFHGQPDAFDQPENVLGEAGRTAFQGRPLSFYTERLGQVRAETLRKLRERDDDWLHRVYQPWGDGEWNNYFCWFHVAEDEMRHQGQITVFRRELERQQAAASGPT